MSSLLAGWASRADEGGTAGPQADPLRIKVIAEVESRSREEGAAGVRLVPADRVVPGDRVLYTLEVRNAGSSVVRTPVVIFAVQEHTRYVDESATGPGADITFSVDGGRRFDVPRNLQVPLAGGMSREAAAADYTHIRWQLRNPLEAGSVAYVRFRAVVK